MAASTSVIFRWVLHLSLLLSFIQFAVSIKAKCTDGPPGPVGPPGPQGITGDASQVESFENWRHCAWRSGNGADYGTIYTCTITKQLSNSALYVAFGGNLRLYGCSGCCKRWYFTFNNAECTSPMAIDGTVYQTNTNNMNLHRHRNIHGYCLNVAAGSVNIGFNVGDCSGYGNYDADTGWNSVSRIIVKEVPEMPY